MNHGVSQAIASEATGIVLLVILGAVGLWVVTAWVAGFASDFRLERRVLTFVTVGTMSGVAAGNYGIDELFKIAHLSESHGLLSAASLGARILWTTIMIFALGPKLQRFAGGIVIERLPKADKTQPIIGIRAWRLKALEDGSMALMSLVVNTVWTPGRSEKGEVGNLVSGVHAFKNAEALRRYLRVTDTAASAYGTIALAGTVVEHEDGYRAQCGYPLKVVTGNADAAARIARAYGCETAVGASLDEGGMRIDDLPLD